jgi:NADH dehydrogenase
VIGLPDSLAYIQAWLMEFAPVELISRDNLDSLAVDSVSTAAFPVELDVQAVSMEAVMTDILAQHTPRERYMRLRDHAGR